MWNIDKLKEKKRLWTNKSSEEHSESRSFILDLWCQQYYNVIVEIMDIKCGLLSKHLSQRTQQHGDCTKPLGNDKFL